MSKCATRRPAKGGRRGFPLHRRSVAVLCALVCLLLATLGVLRSSAVEARRIIVPLGSIVLNPEQIRGVLDAAGSAAERSKDDNNLTETELDNAAGSRPDSHWQYTMVRRGDNLSLLFNRFGLSAREVHAVVSTEGAGAELARLLPGQRVGLQIDEDGDLRGLHLQINHLSEIEYKHQGEGFERIETNHIPERRTLYRRAMVENSLFLAGAGAGLSDDLIMDLAGIFSGVIDFVFDPRTGDSFSVLYEELWLSGQAIGNGNILAAEYVNQGKHYSAFRYVDRQGISGYFDPEGVSMQKTFLRAPLDFSRVSSNFNLRRRHPIHKRVTAHRGVGLCGARRDASFLSG